MEPVSILIAGRDVDEARRLAEIVGTGDRTVVTGLADASTVVRRLAEASAVVVDAGSFSADEAERVVADAAKAPNPVPTLIALREPSVEETVVWMRRGAYAVVALTSGAESLRMQVEQAVRHHELSTRNATLERSLEVHERLAMIGKLAAGVAHELNSPLDGVLRYVNLTIEKLPKESQQVAYLLEARRGLRRMADIVRDLLQFSRNANVESIDEDAERLARDAVEQVVAAQARDRSIETSFDFPAQGVHLPRGMFQVFGNLARNAVDAMPRGGTLRVSLSESNGRHHIDFTDTGTGIPDEIRDRIFEPFFTTKEVGKGTGLGLPICQRIVERLGGALSIESEIGHGTTVRIDLPTRRAAVVPSTRTHDRSASARTQGVF